MKRKSCCTKARLWWVVFVMLLTACGGGGGGGDASPPAGYDGATTRAAITIANMSVLIDSAWDGFQFGPDLGESVLMFDADGNLLGDCGGQAMINALNDDGSGNFNGAITFLDYCASGSTLSGGLSFSGSYNPSTLELVKFKMTFDNLNMTEAADSVTLIQGNLTYRFLSDMSGESLNFDMVLRDNNQAKTYWLNNMSMVITYGPVQDFANVSGRYYDHDHGYLDITTLSPLAILDDGPVSGLLLFTGEASSARLHFNPDFSVFLEIDLEGDGSYVPAP